MSEQTHNQPTDSLPEDDDHPSLEPGRGIELTPVPPGGSLLVLGVVLAVLGPLGGFLAGSMVDIGDATQRVSPMFLYLFAGFVLGGLGLILAGFGGLRLLRHVRASQGG
jgi:hypothetical protein